MGISPQGYAREQRPPGFRCGMVLVPLLGWLCCQGHAAPAYQGGGDSSFNNTGLGYLTAPSLSPGHMLRPSSLFVLQTQEPRGSGRIDFDFHWANVWDYNAGQYMIDGETLLGSVRYSYAVRDDTSIGLAVPIIGWTGGFADSSIEEFHKALQLGDGDRAMVPRNRALITVADQGTDRVVAEGESWGIGDVSVFLASCLTKGTRVWPAVTVQGGVSLPTGNEDELRGLGAPSIALSAVASKRLWESAFISFLGAGFQYCNADDIAMIRIRDEQVSALAGMEYEYSRSLSLLVQYLISSPVAKHYFALAKPSHEVSVGFKWRIGLDNAVELAVVENVAVFRNSADIGVHLTYGRRL